MTAEEGRSRASRAGRDISVALAILSLIVALVFSSIQVRDSARQIHQGQQALSIQRSATTSPNRRVTPVICTSPSTSRGSTSGASSLVAIAPSAGITPQVRRVSAGGPWALSQPAVRPAPLLSALSVPRPARLHCRRTPATLAARLHKDH